MATEKPLNGSSPRTEIKVIDSSDSNSERDEEVAIPKSVGLLSAVGLIAGQIIGSGIFISPVGVLRQVHSVGASLIIWCIGGLSAFVGANCYTELGTMIKESGGDYQYINRGFGDFLSFMFLWANVFIIHPGNRAVVALTFSTYILKPFYGECEPSNTAVVLLAGFVIMLTHVINCISMKAVTRVQVVFMITKCLALLMISITGIVYLGMGRTSNFEGAFEGTSPNPGDWVKGIYSCVFTYAGWNYITTVAEEVKDPAKTLPRGLWISVPMVTALYVLTNFAFFVILDVNEMLSTPAVAVTFGNRVYGVMAWIIPVLVACSTFGGLNSLTYTPSRMFFVGARNGHTPEFLKTINLKYFTPIPALFVQAIITMVVLLSGEVFTLITCISFVETSFIGLSIFSLLFMRKKYPHWKRPVKVNLFFPICYACFTLLLLIISVVNGGKEALLGICLTAAGIPVYLICVCWKKKPKSFDRFMARFTKFIQKIFYAAPENTVIEAIEEVKHE